jgi:hypothetical protein
MYKHIEYTYIHTYIHTYIYISYAPSSDWSASTCTQRGRSGCSEIKGSYSGLLRYNIRPRHATLILRVLRSSFRLEREYMCIHHIRNKCTFTMHIKHSASAFPSSDSPSGLLFGPPLRAPYRPDEYGRACARASLASLHKTSRPWAACTACLGSGES